MRVLATTIRAGEAARLPAVLADPRLEGAVGWAASPTRVVFLTVRDASADLGPVGGSLEGAYTARLWTGAVDVAWSAGPVPRVTVRRLHDDPEQAPGESGEATGDRRKDTADRLPPGDRQPQAERAGEHTEPVDATLAGRRVLWGRAGDTAGGWTQLAGDRTAPLWVPADIPAGRRAALSVLELVCVRRGGVAAGNAAVAGELITGLAPYVPDQPTTTEKER